MGSEFSDEESMCGDGESSMMVGSEEGGGERGRRAGDDTSNHDPGTDDESQSGMDADRRSLVPGHNHLRPNGMHSTASDLTNNEMDQAKDFFDWMYDTRRDKSNFSDPGTQPADSPADPPEGVSNEWIMAALKVKKVQFLSKFCNCVAFYNHAFQIDIRELGCTSVVRKAAQRNTLEMSYVYHFLILRSLLCVDTEDGIGVREICDRIFKSISYGYKLLVLALQTRVVVDDELYSSQQQTELAATHFRFPDPSKPERPRIALYLHLLELLKQNGLRRINKDCYEQIYVTNTVSGLIFSTHAWRRHSSISEFIHRNVTKELDYSIWEHLRASPNEADIQTKWLTEAEEWEFPTLEYDQNIRSFRGDADGRCGGLHHMAGAFFPWDSRERWEMIAERCNSFWTFMGHGKGKSKAVQCSVPTSSTCALKFFEEPFDQRWADVEVVYRGSLSHPEDGDTHDHRMISYDEQCKRWLMSDALYPDGTLFGIRAIEDEIPDGCPSGLVWERCVTRPRSGHALTSVQLAQHFSGVDEGVDTVEFTSACWMKFNVTGLRHDHYVHIPESSDDSVDGDDGDDEGDEACGGTFWRPGRPTREDEMSAPNGTGLDKITNDQHLDPITRLVLYAYFGRGLVPMRCRDDLQTALYMWGVAGAGKSLLLNLLSALFPNEMTEVISPNTEKTFGLMSLYKAKLIIWPEAEGDPKTSGLSTADIKVLIEGGRVAVRIKHEASISVDWISQLFMAGNSLPMWTLSGFDLLRRIVIIRWKCPILDTDQTLPDRLHDHFGSFLARNCCSHLALILWLGKRSIWAKDHNGNYIVGSQIHDAQMEMRLTLDPLYHFITTGAGGTLCVWDKHSSDDIADYMMSEDDFISTFNAWCSNHNISKRKWQADYYNHVFVELGLSIEKDGQYLDAENQTKTGRCICGVRKV